MKNFTSALILSLLLISSVLSIQSSNTQSVTSDCKTEFDKLKQNFVPLTHTETWQNENTYKNQFKILLQNIEDIEQKCAICSPSISTLKQDFQEVQEDAENKDKIFNLITTVINIFTKTESAYLSCIKKSQIGIDLEAAYNCDNAFETLKDQGKKLLTFDLLKFEQSFKNIAMLDIMSSITQIQSLCGSCVQPEFLDLKQNFQNLLTEIEGQNFLQAAMEIFDTVEGLASAVTTCFAKNNEYMQEFDNQKCKTRFNDLKGYLKDMTSLSLWSNEQERNDKIGKILDSVAGLSDDCKKCSPKIKVLQQNIQNMVDDVKSLSIFKLITSGITTIKTVENTYNECLVN